MSVNQPEINPNWPATPPKPGMSASMKLILGLGVGCGVVVVLCCGGLFISGFLLQAQLAKMISDDPETVVATTQKIAQIDIPDDLEPAFSADIKLPVVGSVASCVAYEDKDNQSGDLVLIALGESLGAGNQAEFQRQIQQSLEEAGMGQQDEEDLEIDQSYEKEITVRGQPVTFRFVKGKSKDSEAERIMVTGVFAGRSGPTTFLFGGDAKKYDDNTIVKMIESIE